MNSGKGGARERNVGTISIQMMTTGEIKRENADEEEAPGGEGEAERRLWQHARKGWQSLDQSVRGGSSEH